MAVRKREWLTKEGAPKAAWVVDYTDQHGKRRSRQFTRKKDADAFQLTAKTEVLKGVHSVAHESPTVAVAAADWLKDRRAAGLEPTTLAAYEQHVRLHINPRYGRLRLAQLTTPKVMEYSRFWNSELSHSMAKRVLRVFKAIIDQAMRDGRVAQNVASVVKSPRAKRAIRKDIPSKKILRLMLECADGSNVAGVRPLVHLMIYTGLRVSELRGLLWNDINFQRATLSVERRASARGVLGAPKSASGVRSIPLSAKTLVILADWKACCPPSARDLVFPSIKGQVISYEVMHKQMFAPTMRQAVRQAMGEDSGMRFGFHDFRHAAASLWIEQNLSPKKVQELMGHSSITMTFDTYGHLFSQRENDGHIAEAMEAGIFTQ